MWQWKKHHDLQRGIEMETESEKVAVSLPKRKRDWVGRYVRLAKQFTTWGGKVFEVGEILRVDRNYSGLHVSTIKHCPTCFRYAYEQALIPESYVELLPVEYEPEFATLLLIDQERADIFRYLVNNGQMSIAARVTIVEMLKEIEK